jgi:hypothetical protein
MTEMLAHVNKERLKGVNAKALILLGSGPKPKRAGDSHQTSDNPLDFVLKQKVVKSKLIEVLPTMIESGLDSSSDTLDDLCTIQEMTTPFSDVSKFVEDTIESEEISSISSIKIFQYAGNKDDDGTKLTSILDHSHQVAVKKIDEKKMDLEEENELRDKVIPISVGVIALEPMSSGAESMSATQIRERAYNEEMKEWMTYYHSFYKDNSEEVYAALITHQEEYRTKQSSKVKRSATKRAKSPSQFSPSSPTKRAKARTDESSGTKLEMDASSPSLKPSITRVRRGGNGGTRKLKKRA